MMRFDGKTALVTGGGSGIGQCISVQLAREGAYIVVVDLNETAAKLTLNEISANGGKGEILVCDISNNSDVTETVSDILKNRAIDILINNAGIAHIGNIENTTEADLDRVYSVNVKGIYNMLSVIIPAMKIRRHGVIINMASVSAFRPKAELVAYNTSKAGVDMMTKSVALHCARSGYSINVNSINPGVIQTDMLTKVINQVEDGEALMDSYKAMHPIGRIGEPEDIAAMAVYLASEEASFITGSGFTVDGSLSNN